LKTHQKIEKNASALTVPVTPPIARMKFFTVVSDPVNAKSPLKVVFVIVAPSILSTICKIPIIAAWKK